jgi:hypothetical protein
MIILTYSELHFDYTVVRRVNMRRKMDGAMIGIAVGLYVVSTLLTNLSSEIYCVTPLHIWGLTFISSIIIAGFCYFGIHLMSDINGSMERK